MEKEKSSSAEPSVPQRPKSQPTQTQPSFVPPPSAPPNLQQQQKAERQYKADSKAGTPSSTFNRRDLVENLLKSTAGSFAYQQPITKSTAPRVRKKSVTPLFGKKPPTVHRTSSKEAKLDTQPTVESDTEPDEPSEPAKKPPTAAANPPAFDYEPMDAEPTGTPKTMPTSTPATAIPNGVPKKRSSLDMSGLSAAIPPLSRSPADVGLAEFETLKSSLPPLQPTSPKSPLSNQFRTLRMNKRPANIPYIPKNDPFVFRMPTEFWKFPQTPGPDAPFEVPKPPPVPKTPQGEDVNLDDYNRFYHTLGPYIEAWNRYEAEVHALRADLKSRTMQVSSTQTLDTVDIVKYMDRVKKKDTVLDQSFTKARDKHLKGLDKWVKLRVRVLEDIGQQQQH